MRLIFFFLLAICFHFANAQTGNNTIKGSISFPDIKQKVFHKGNQYADGTLNLDSINEPRINVYVSMHPIDFQVELPIINAQMSQRNKTFFPNIVAITAGSTVYFLNEDEHFHNIYSLTPKARFNIGRRPPGNVYGKKINKVGVVKLGCDIHPEMGAVILSLDTPFFTKVNSDGTYEISKLPDGNYELRVFHPAFQRYSLEISCKNGQVIHQVINLENKA